MISKPFQLVVKDNLSVVDNNDFSGEVRNVAKIMGCKNKGGPQTVHFQNEFTIIILGNNIESYRRLIEKHNLRALHRVSDEFASFSPPGRTQGVWSPFYFLDI